MNIDIIDIDTVDATTVRIDGVEFAKSACSVSAYGSQHAQIVADGQTFIVSHGSSVDGRRPRGQRALLYAIQQLLLAGRDVFDYYVDSVGGNDAFPGTIEAPFATLAKAATVLAEGVSVGLKRGSTWAEELRTTATHCRIGAYGSGALPVIDARDTVASWSKTGGQVNVYETTWTPTGPLTKCAPSLWENGVRLQRVANLAACDATPGSFYASSSFTTGVAAALYVHATGSVDPATLTYQQATRYACITLGDYGTVQNIRGIASQHNDGVIILGRFSRAERCVVEDGQLHSLFLGSGVARDCIAYKADRWFNTFAAGGTMIAFIGYNTANAADPLRWERCSYAYGDDDYSFGAGFYCHATPGQTSFGDVEIVDCESYNAAAFCEGAAEAESLLIDGALTYNTGRFLGNSAGSAKLPGGVTIRRSEWFLDRNPTEITYRGVYRPSSAYATKITVEDSFAVLTGLGASHVSNSPFTMFPVGITGTLTVERVALISSPLASSHVTGFLFDVSTATDFDLTIRNSVVQGFASYASDSARGWHMQIGAGIDAFTASNNVYAGMNGATERGAVKYRGTTYATATAYLAAVQPAIDTGSVSAAVSQFTGTIANRDYTVGSGVAAETMGCVPQMTVKYAGPLSERLTELVAEVEAL